MKLAAFDFDGTILFDDGIPAHTIDAMHRWQAAGHLAVASTGKSLAAAKFGLTGYDLAFDYSVLFTGGVVTDKADTVLHSTYLDTKTVQDIIAHLKQIDGIGVYAARLTERDACFAYNVPGGSATNILRDSVQMTEEEIPVHTFIGIPIWVPGDDTLREELVAWIRANVEVECVVNQDFIDIIPAGCTKGSGLYWLANHLGIPRSEVELYTFGDSFNDLSMHEVADESFSFTWSPADVQAHTTHVIDGVDAVLDRLR